jgi:hypothetical protein
MPGVVLVHRYQQSANDSFMQSVCPFEEFDAVRPGQPEVGRDERHVLAPVGQPLEEL